MLKTVLKTIGIWTSGLWTLITVVLWAVAKVVGVPSVNDVKETPSALGSYVKLVASWPWQVPAGLAIIFAVIWAYIVWKAFRALDVPSETKDLLTSANEIQSRHLSDIAIFQKQAQEASKKIFDWERIGTLQFHALPRLQTFRIRLDAAKDVLVSGAASVSNTEQLLALINKSQIVAAGALPGDSGNYPMRMGWYFPQRPYAQEENSFDARSTEVLAPNEDILAVEEKFLYRSAYNQFESADRLWAHFEEKINRAVSELYPDLGFA